MRREAIARGQVALAYRIGPAAGDMMQDFVSVQPGPTRTEMMQDFMSEQPQRTEMSRLNKSYQVKLLAIGRTRERVYTGPAVGGALPRTVLDRVQVEALDWRYRDLMKAHLRPEHVGATMMALVRTPAGKTHYEALNRRVLWD